jgi:hypothetical protein
MRCYYVSYVISTKSSLIFGVLPEFKFPVVNRVTLMDFINEATTEACSNEGETGLVKILSWQEVPEV